VNLLASLLASRMAYDAYGDTDWIALGIFLLGLVAGYGMGGFSNYFLRRPFVADAVWSVVLMCTVTFLAINFINKEGGLQAFGVGMDPRMVPAGLLVLFALWVLAGLALLCSTRLELMSTLAVCTAVFLLGLISDYLFARTSGQSWWGSLLYHLLPNWQLFWVADALEEGRSIPWNYVGTAFGYTAAYIGGVLALALYLFEDRELS
jgi:hypothetical protein